MATIRETVHYTGRVQGVGFRYTTASLAKDFEVAGSVKNLPDGRVKLVAEGEAQQVAGLIDAVQEAMSGNITDVESSRSIGTGEFGTPGDPRAFRVIL
ncbi:MAG: acylphosphatase [Planctomycetota bacterium]